MAYSMGMTTGANFEFAMGAFLSRRNFISEVYDKIVADFSAKMNINNIGALSGSTAQEIWKFLTQITIKRASFKEDSKLDIFQKKN